MIKMLSFEEKFAASQAAFQAKNAERIQQTDKLSLAADKARSDKILAATSSPSQPAATVATGKEGAAAVAKALDNSTKAFAKLSDLHAQIADATASGAALSKEQTSALNDKIKAVAAEIDKLAAGAKVGKTNLLEKTPGGVTVVAQSGAKVNIATQASDSKALGLSDLKITDEASLRQATAAIAKAAGQTQLTVFRLQGADGITGTPAPVNAGLAAFDKIRSSNDAAPAAGSVSDSVAKALANQSAALATNYGSSGSLSTSSAPSIINLFA